MTKLSPAHIRHVTSSALNTTDSAAKIARQCNLTAPADIAEVAVRVNELRAHRVPAIIVEDVRGVK